MPIGKPANGAVADAPQSAPVSRPLNTGTESQERGSGDAKGRRILVQGITQAVVQSPIVASLASYTTPEQVVDLVKKVSKDLIAFVEDESR